MDKKELKLRRKLNIFFAISMILLYCLYCFVLVPLGVMCDNTVPYKDTIMPTVIEYIYDLVEIVAIAFAYAVSIYSIYRYGVGKIGIPAIIFSSVTLFKHMSNVLMTWINNGFDINVWSDIRSVLVPLFFELLQYFVVLLIAYKVISNHLEFVAQKQKAGRKLGAVSVGDGIYPFRSFIDLENPVIKSAFWAGVVVAATKVAQRVFYDILYTIMFGIPHISEIPGMIIYYLSDVLCGVACYFAVIWLLMLLLEKKFKRELYE